MIIDRIIDTLPTKPAKDRATMRENAERWLATGSEPQKADAGRLLAALDELEANQQAEMRQRFADMPVASRVVEAFRREPLTETERAVIQALVDNPGSLSSELSKSLGWEGAWSAHFGALCRKRQVYLWPAPEKFDDTGKDFYTSILADFKDMRITLKPDVAVALATIGIKAKA